MKGEKVKFCFELFSLSPFLRFSITPLFHSFDLFDFSDLFDSFNFSTFFEAEGFGAVVDDGGMGEAEVAA